MNPNWKLHSVCRFFIDPLTYIIWSGTIINKYLYRIKLYLNCICGGLWLCCHLCKVPCHRSNLSNWRFIDSTLSFYSSSVLIIDYWLQPRYSKYVLFLKLSMPIVNLNIFAFTLKLCIDFNIYNHCLFTISNLFNSLSLACPVLVINTFSTA